MRHRVTVRRSPRARLLAGALVSAQTLRIGLAEDPDVLDPTLARSFVGRVVFAALCDKLFDIDDKLDDRAAARDVVRMVAPTTRR